MKVVMPGGSGHVGAALRRHLEALGWEFVVLTRQPLRQGEVAWDGTTLGDWVKEFDGADIVLNLAGRSVNCRYDEAHLKEMMDSRVDSTRVVGQAIAQAAKPPRLWLQASTATIYAHRFDAANDEETGIIGGDEPGVPYMWNASIAIAKAWEEELERAANPSTRKVAMRSAMTMSVDDGSIFDVLAKLARRGLAGSSGNGRQYVSWIHETDFCRAVEFLAGREDLSGPVNICAPNPLPNEDFMAVLRDVLNVRLGLSAPAWMLEIGARLMKTETELVLKSRRVVPKRLLDAGFTFEHPTWPEAARELAERWKAAG